MDVIDLYLMQFACVCYGIIAVGDAAVSRSGAGWPCTRPSD